jgi:transcriptional regulator with XRE-family HTH domain
VPRARYDQRNAPELAQLGAAIRELRAEQGLKQIEVAAAADISETQISEIERGKRNPGWRLLTRLVTQGLESSMAELAERYERQQRERR